MRIKTAIAILGYALFIGNYIDVRNCDSKISELLQQNNPVVQQNLDKSPSSLEKKIIEQSQDEPAKKSFTLPNYPRNNTTNAPTDYAETYDNINKTPESELNKSLAKRCNSNCLYYTTDEGDIHEVEGIGTIYTREGECFGSFRGDKGWMLLDFDGEIRAWGNNASDTSNVTADKLIEYGVCENDE